VSWHGDVCRLVVIDGLGHGPEAARVAERARQVCDGLPDVAPARVLEVCHAALHGLRGGAVSVARIDVAAAQLTFAGVGNVEARLLQGGQQQRLSPDRGIAGVRLPRIVPLDVALLPAWTVALYSDGLDAHFPLPAARDAGSGSPAELAAALLQRWALPSDDATLAIAWRTPA
jgi:hypothetical protein